MLLSSAHPPAPFQEAKVSSGGATMRCRRWLPRRTVRIYYYWWAKDFLLKLSLIEPLRWFLQSTRWNRIIGFLRRTEKDGEEKPLELNWFLALFYYHDNTRLSYLCNNWSTLRHCLKRSSGGGGGIKQMRCTCTAYCCWDNIWEARNWCKSGIRWCSHTWLINKNVSSTEDTVISGIFSGLYHLKRG